MASGNSELQNVLSLLFGREGVMFGSMQEHGCEERFGATKSPCLPKNVRLGSIKPNLHFNQP
jgi:hypothetical protein